MPRPTVHRNKIVEPKVSPDAAEVQAEPKAKTKKAKKQAG